MFNKSVPATHTNGNKSSEKIYLNLRNINITNHLNSKPMSGDQTTDPV